MSSDTEPAAPPRLLLGVALLFWGGISDRALLGLVLALIVEGAHWTRFRWEFADTACQRAWRATFLLFLLAVTLVWLSASIVSAVPDAVTWLPLILLPIQFVQAYGVRASIPLTTFSHFLRKRREHAARYGLPFREVRIHFGQTYFIGILLAASLTEGAKTAVFFPGAVILIAWSFHRHLLRKPRLAPAGAVGMLALAAAGGYGGEELLETLYKRMRFENYGRLEYARETRTSIGTLGEIKQSPSIRWRLKPIEGGLPDLLRVASYNTYVDTSWGTLLPPGVESGTNDFLELDSYGVGEPYRVTAREDEATFLPGPEASRDSLPRFILRGSFPDPGLLPIPGGSASIVQPNQNIEINPFGTLRLDPTHPVTNATILWDDPLTTARAPWPPRPRDEGPPPDLRVPADERDAIRRVVDELGLRDVPLGEKITRLRAHFREHFTYTRYLRNRSPDERDFIAAFLEDTRRGHCEYFATAATFLLRESGTPARYATGFAVVEKHPRTGQALIRGTHAHAWSLAWDAENDTWIDVDLTPPSWVAADTPRVPAWQPLLDRWQMLRDDILVWRSQPGNLSLAITLMVTPIAIGALLVLRRLWTSKRRVDATSASATTRPTGETTALAELERAARDHLGPRPPGTPLTRWLARLAPTLVEPSPLHEAIRLHQLIRFDPRADDPAHRENLATAVDHVTRQLAETERRF